MFGIGWNQRKSSLEFILVDSFLWTQNCITEINATSELEAFWCTDFVYCVMQREFTGRAINTCSGRGELVSWKQEINKKTGV